MKKNINQDIITLSASEKIAKFVKYLEATFIKKYIVGHFSITFETQGGRGGASSIKVLRNS